MIERQYNYHKPKKQIPKITQEYLHALLDFNPETGIWVWKYAPHLSKRRTTMFGGKVAGSFYAEYHWIRIDGRQIQSHRLALLYTRGSIPARVRLKSKGETSSRLSNLWYSNNSNKREVTHV